MKSKIFTFFTVFVTNLLVLTVLFEISSRLLLSDYIDSKLNKIVHPYQFKEEVERHSIFAFDNQEKIPHPYLGYIRFHEKRNFDILHEKKNNSNDHIAIFGGSVAENFYHFNKEKYLLQESLKKVFGLKKENSFGLKNYAIGGYKQPQHLIATILFRPKAEVTISIEGYNELNGSLGGQFPYYYPMWPISKLYYSGVENWKLYFKAGETRAYQRKLKILIEKNWWFKLVPTLLKVFYFMEEKSLAGLEQKLNRQKEQDWEKGFFKPLPFLEKIIYWLERSCEQQNFLAKRGVKSYFFFQPVPYVSKSKKLTDHEKQMIEEFKNKVQMDWGKKHHIQNMIESFLLIRKIIKRGNLSLNLVDTSQIFLNEPREVFVDGYCHINQLGHSLLTQKIAKVIKETYSELEKPKLCHDDFRSLVEKFR